MPNSDDSSNEVPQVTPVRQLISSQLSLMSEQMAMLSSTASPALRRVSPPRIQAPALAATSISRPREPVAHVQNERAPGVRQQAYLDSFLDLYNKTHKGSKDYAERYRKVLADSRRSAGYRPSLKSILYPIVGRSASGSHIQDIDGNDYIDLTMGFGALLNGHNPAFIQAAHAECRAAGLDIGPQSRLAGDVAERLADLTGLPRVAFCNSGTEAVMTALRLSRAATGRSRIAIFSGSYHGHFDGTLAMAGPNGGLPVSPGTPAGYTEDVIVLPYGTEDTLSMLRAQIGSLAAVLVEPVQSRALTNQPEAFLRALRELCTQGGAALIFDEMLTGFRIALGGAQAWFGVRADLATYGKIIGGGTPIGVVAGEAAYLDGIDGGAWGYDDGSYPAADRVFFAGTYNKNATSMAVSQAVLRKLAEEGPQLQATLNQKTQDLVEELNAHFTTMAIPGRVVSFGSIFRFEFQSNADILFYHLIQNGIYVWEGRACFLSTAHTQDDIAAISQAVAKSLRAVSENGLLT